MARQYVPRDPSTLTSRELEAVVATIQEILWLQPEGDWDPDKEWDAGLGPDVADVLTRAGLRPA